jgi:hypothetical protein
MGIYVLRQYPCVLPPWWRLLREQSLLRSWVSLGIALAADRLLMDMGDQILLLQAFLRWKQMLPF